MDTIMRSHVIREIDSGEPFTIEFITADRRRGTGGKWVVLENWVKVRDGEKKTSAPVSQVQCYKKEKHPEHYRHGTLNLRNPGNKALHIVKVHTALMQIFNGKKVING